LSDFNRRFPTFSVLADLAEGDNVGAPDGAPDGAGDNVGEPDGAPVGEPDGAGDNVGEPDGAPVGDNVGEPDGAPVGEPDGAGDNVGEPEGGCDFLSDFRILALTLTGSATIARQERRILKVEVNILKKYEVVYGSVQCVQLYSL